MEVIRQLDQLPYLYALKSLVNGNLNETYDKLPQSWRERNQLVAVDEVSCTDANHFICLFEEIIIRGQSVEQIRNCFAFLTLENHVGQPPVVFGMSKPGGEVPFRWIKMTKTKFQTVQEKVLQILKFFTVRVYR